MHSSLRLVRPTSAPPRRLRLSTPQEREEASAIMERLIDAGVPYAEARAAVRGHVTLGVTARFGPARGEG